MSGSLCCYQAIRFRLKHSRKLCHFEQHFIVLPNY
jgi:hypothetical protein